MASLKDINSSIEEGNENTEKLNANFAKWFKSQGMTGDDLEAAKEARLKKRGGGGGRVITAAATGAVAAKAFSMDIPFKKLIIGAGLAGLGAMLGMMFKQQLLDFIKNAIPKLPIGSGIEEEIEGTGKGVAQVGNKFRQRQRLLAERAAARKLAASYNQRGDMRANQRTRFLADRATLGRGAGRTRTDGGLSRAISGRTRARQGGDRGSSRQQVNMKSGSGVRFNPALAGGGRYQNIDSGKIVKNETARKMIAAEKARVAAEKANAKANSAQSRNSKLRKLLQGSSSLIKNVNVSVGSAFRQYNDGSPVRSMPAKGIPNPNTFRGTTVAFGDAVINFLARLPAPSWAKKVIKILLHPKMLRFIGSKLVLLEVGLIICGYAIDYTPRPVITRTYYTTPEKIYFLSLFFAGVAASVIGATIGAVIGTFVLGTLGTISGGLVGMWLGFQAPYKIMEFIVNWARGNTKIYSQELLAFKAKQSADMRKFAESRSASGMIGANASPAGMANYDAGFMKGTLLSDQGAGTGVALSATLPQNSYEAILERNRNEGAMSRREEAFGGFSISSSKKKVSKVKAALNFANKGLSFVASALGIKTASAGTMSTSSFTTPTVSGPDFELNGRGLAMAGQNASAPVIVDASTKSFSDHKSVHMLPPVAPMTVDSMEYRTRAYNVIGSAVSGMGLVN